MSYAVSSALQTAVFARLQADSALATLVGNDIFDALPQGSVPPLYVSLGPEIVQDASDGSGAGARHDFIVSVVTETAGFIGAKNVAVAISDCLDGAELTMSRGRLVGLWFRKARATRESGGLRRIDMTFRARVEDD